MITFKNCDKIHKCKKYNEGLCPIINPNVEQFCMKWFKINSLQDEALLSDAQKINIPISVPILHLAFLLLICFFKTFVFLLGVLLAAAASSIFAMYNLYRAIMAGLGVYNLKGLLTVFKKLIDKI